LFLLKTFKALNGLSCADVPLRNYSLTHSHTKTSYFYLFCYFLYLAVFTQNV